MSGQNDTTLGTWSVSVTGLYHVVPTCAGPGTCTGTESTLVETVTYTFTLVDFTFTASPAIVPFWCPAAAQGSNCTAGQSGSSVITVTPQGFTGTVTISTFSVAPATPALTVGYSQTSIPGASGTSTATFSVGALRPTTLLGSYTVSTRGSGTIGTFARFITINFVVRPQNFNITTSNGTPTGPSLSFASGSSATDTLTIGSLPSGSVAVNSAGFAGTVTLSSAFTGGTGLTITPASGTVTLVAGQKLTDVVTFGGTAATTTIFTVTITGTATLATSTPSTQTHSVTYSVTITVASVAHPTSTTVSCTTPVVINQGSPCNVTVTDNSATGATTPTGTVSLSETGVTGTFTTCTLAGTTASATCTSTFTASTSGTAAVTASYPGVTNQFQASSGTTSIVVNPRATTTTVTCTTPVVINVGSTCNVTVTDVSSGTTSTPTGTVALSETGVTGSFTTCTLAGTTALATCTSTFTASTSGTASSTANYPGDGAHAASSGTANIVVNIRGTNTTVVCSPTSISPGLATTCTATVTDPATNPGTRTTPTGTVTFASTGAAGTFTGSPCNLVAGTLGTATCQATFTPGTGTGTANVVGKYTGHA